MKGYKKYPWLDDIAEFRAKRDAERAVGEVTDSAQAGTDPQPPATQWQIGRPQKGGAK